MTPRRSSTFSSSGTVHGSFSNGICQYSSYFSTGASRTSIFFATALALGDLGRDAGHALDLVGRHDRAAGEAPDAAVDDANAEAVGLDGAAATAAAEAVAAEAAAAGEDLTVAQCQRLRTISREADVGVRTAEPLRLRQRDADHSR